MKPHKLTKQDIPKYTNGDDWTDPVEVHGGYSVRVEVTRDDCMGEPWKEHYGYGIVSDWTTRDKTPGERVLCEDRGSKHYYDVSASMVKARAEGWDAPPYTGTKGERAARAVDRDFDYLRRWCNDDWYWVVVGVEVSHRGAILDTDYCGGIESDGDYWREHAADVANCTIESDRTKRKAAAVAARIEKRERSYWESRDMVTA